MIKVNFDTVNRPEETGGCWPTRHQELLLQAALLPGEPAHQAWLQWNRAVDLIEDTLDPGSFRLLPLVYHNLRRDDLDAPHLGRLRGIHRRTWVENQMRFHVCAGILRKLTEAGIETLILKGAALVALHYADFGVRPMSDFDVWVPKARVHDAIATLGALQWSPNDRPLHRLTPAYFNVRHSQGFAGPQGQELDLHWHVLNTGLDTAVDEQFWQGATPVRVQDVATRAPNPTDLLVHVCVHGLAWSSTPPLRWAADAAVILSTPTTTIDWARLARLAEMGRCSLQLHAALSYLQRVLNLPIPGTALATLAALPATTEDRNLFRVGTRRSVGLGQLPLLWHRHRRYKAQLNAQTGGSLSFPHYVQVYLGLGSLVDVGAWLVTRMLKRTRIWFTHKRANPGSG